MNNWYRPILGYAAGVNDDTSVLEQTAALLDSLRGVFDGEAVDELAHALQAAGRAVADGADDVLAVAQRVRAAVTR